jgi:hypothetical protein
MKKIMVGVAVLIALIGMMAGDVLAVGACVQTGNTKTVNVLGSHQRKIVTLTCTGDAGGIAAYSFNPTTFGVVGWYLYNITTDPGAAAPTDNYDITLMVNGEDIAGGLLVDRSTSATQTKAIASSAIGYFMVDEDRIIITFANEVANPATIVMTLRFTAN